MWIDSFENIMRRHLLIVLLIAMMISIPPLMLLEKSGVFFGAALLGLEPSPVSLSFASWERNNEILRSSSNLVKFQNGFFLEFHGYAAGFEKMYLVYDLGTFVEATAKNQESSDRLKERVIPTFEQIPKGSLLSEGRKKYFSVQEGKVYMVVVKSEDGSVYALKQFYVPPKWSREGVVVSNYNGPVIKRVGDGKVLDAAYALTWDSKDVAYYKVVIDGKASYSPKESYVPKWLEIAPTPRSVSVSVCGVDVWGNEGGCSAGAILYVDVALPMTFEAIPSPGKYPAGTMVRFKPVSEQERLYYSSVTSKGASGFVSSYQPFRLDEDTRFSFYLTDELGRVGPPQVIEYTVEPFFSTSSLRGGSRVLEGVGVVRDDRGAGRPFSR